MKDELDSEVAKLKASEAKMEAKMVLMSGLKLPIQLTNEDIKLVNVRGNTFTDSIQEFTKQTIIDAFSSSTKIRFDADKKIGNALKEKIRKHVSVITIEQ